jgi:DNA-binding NarL/FixJ family response regulator
MKNETATKNLKSKKVILGLVEDSELMRSTILTFLKKKQPNLLVFESFSLETALEMVLKQKPTHVLIDFFLENGVTALEVAQMLKGFVNSKKIENLPKLALYTAGSLAPKELENISYLGVSVVFEKPVSKESFDEFFEKLLDWLTS